MRLSQVLIIINQLFYFKIKFKVKSHKKYKLLQILLNIKIYFLLRILSIIIKLLHSIMELKHSNTIHSYIIYLLMIYLLIKIPHIVKSHFKMHKIISLFAHVLFNSILVNFLKPQTTQKLKMVLDVFAKENY